MQALAVFLLWGYVHFTYIMNPEDCLKDVTQRPFPLDVILQVEVYSNDSELWEERQKAIEQLYLDLYNRSHTVYESDGRATYTRDKLMEKSCQRSLLVNWTGAHGLCLFILNFFNTTLEIASVYEEAYLDNEQVMDTDTAELENDSEDENGNPVQDSCHVKDIFLNRRDIAPDPNIPIQLIGVPKEKREEVKAAVFDKNYTLFELFTFYGM